MGEWPIHNVTVKAGGEYYGIDSHLGYLALQYGIKEKWAADLNIGYTSAGWRSFNTTGATENTSGLMDISFGVRYQIFNEKDADSPWIPTLTFRAGAVLPGTYEQSFAFDRGPVQRQSSQKCSCANILAGRVWVFMQIPFFDGTGRRTMTRYIAVIGFFQQIKGWELAAGYRHLQTITGSDIVLNGNDITYPKDLREISDAIEAGFSYTTSVRHIRYGFQSRTVVDGNNTDAKFWVGGSIDIPFGGKHAQ